MDLYSLPMRMGEVFTSSSCYLVSWHKLISISVSFVGLNNFAGFFSINILLGSAVLSYIYLKRVDFLGENEDIILVVSCNPNILLRTKYWLAVWLRNNL